MKKFILFGWDQYYPSGGLRDMDSNHDSIEEAQEAFNHRKFDWGQIVDRDTWEVVRSLKNSKY